MSIRVDPNGFSQERVHRSVFSILRGNVLCSIATVTEENKAHINTAYFCYSDDLELYFLSDPGSLHCRNLSTNSSMAVTVFRSSQRWGGPDEGLQLFGTCTQARGPQATKAQRLYRERFPAYAEWVAGLRDERVGRDYRFFRFLTDRLKVLDEKKFGDAVFVTAAVKRDRRLL
jgi:uncharacterized protein YhbP (UPF0306 family)